MKLTSSLANGRNCRTVDEFDRPLQGVGYANFARPCLSFQLAASDEERAENVKARDYRLWANQLDLEQIISRIFNPIGQLTLGQLTKGNFEDDAALRFSGRVAKSVGLALCKYKVTAEGREYFILAASLDHAQSQVRKYFPKWVGKADLLFVEIFNCG